MLLTQPGHRSPMSSPLDPTLWQTGTSQGCCNYNARLTPLFCRFIQDIMLVDDELPMAFVNTTTSFFGVIAETVIVMISSKYVSASIPVLILVLWVIQKFYLRTSKQLRLMDIEAKAPLSAFL